MIIERQESSDNPAVVSMSLGGFCSTLDCNVDPLNEVRESYTIEFEIGEGCRVIGKGRNNDCRGWWE